MTSEADQLQNQLGRLARNQSFDLYQEAKTFVKNLNDAIAALRQPDVANYFNGRYTLQATTVPELVKQMTDKGLQFAPAIPGDEGAYKALHQTLAAADRALHATTKPPTPKAPTGGSSANYGPMIP